MALSNWAGSGETRFKNYSVKIGTLTGENSPYANQLLRLPNSVKVGNTSLETNQNLTKKILNTSAEHRNDKSLVKR